MKLEIIIPTLDRVKDITLLLESVLLQKRKPEFVTIVDAGTKHANYSIFQELFQKDSIIFKTIQSPRGLTHQRNVGIEQSTGDIILFLDDDTIIHHGYIEKIMEVFESDFQNKIGGVMGKVTNFKSRENFFNRIFRKIFFLPVISKGELISSGFGNSISNKVNEKITVDWLSGCNMAYRKEVFLWNLFDENLKLYSYAEDLDFSTRVGKHYKLVYEPEAVLDHNSSIVNRINYHERYKMLIRNHAYLFKKNHAQTINNKFAFHISLLGISIQALLLERTFQGFKGAAVGLIEVIFLRNFSMPNYLERLDFNHPNKKQIASHLFRYNEISKHCLNLDILDCACGEGIGVKILAKTARSVTGVDINPETIQKAKSNVQFGNVRFINGSAIELPFNDASFDIISSVETLEHIPRIYHHQVLKEFHRVLKPGGKLILTTPNKNRTSPGKIAPGNYFHIAELIPDDLISIISQHFKEVTIYGIFNFIREGTLEQTFEDMIEDNNQDNSRKTMISLRKRILCFFPNWLRDSFSVLLTGKSIYPQINEFEINQTKYKNASDLFCVARSNK